MVQVVLRCHRVVALPANSEVSLAVLAVPIRTALRLEGRCVRADACREVDGELARTLVEEVLRRGRTLARVALRSVGLAVETVGVGARTCQERGEVCADESREVGGCRARGVVEEELRSDWGVAGSAHGAARELALLAVGVGAGLGLEGGGVGSDARREGGGVDALAVVEVELGSGGVDADIAESVVGLALETGGVLAGLGAFGVEVGSGHVGEVGGELAGASI